jgi:cobalt/nickel transport system permease protein
MANSADPFLELATLDALAGGSSAIHRVEPRAKVVTVAAFVTVVASFGRYDVARLLPLALFPVVLATLSDTPARYLLKRMLAALPFVLFVGILNPFLDRAPALTVGGLTLSGGWLSFASILLRFALTVSAALTLMATTRFDEVCLALERLGLPRVFTLQLTFLYRYAFVLFGEAQRMLQAFRLRAFGHRLSLGAFASMAAQLLLRTWDRAARIHRAMLARGFTGRFHPPAARAWALADTLFTLGWLAAFATLRWVDLPRLLGGLARGGRG